MSTLTEILLAILICLIIWKYFGAQIKEWPLFTETFKKAPDAHGHDHDHGHAAPSPALVKVVVFVPVAYSDIVRDALSHAGAGKRPGFASETFSVRGLGRWQKVHAAPAPDAHAPSHDAHATEGGHDDHHADPHHVGHDAHHDPHAEPAPHQDSHAEAPVVGDMIYGEEDRIETIVPKADLETVLAELKRLHVDTHMAIDLYPVDLPG